MQVNNQPIVESTLFYSANNWLVLKYGNSLFKIIYAKKMQNIFYIKQKSLKHVIYSPIFCPFLEFSATSNKYFYSVIYKIDH